MSFNVATRSSIARYHPWLLNSMKDDDDTESCVYHTIVNREFLNYLSKLKYNQKSNPKYVQNFIQPDVSRITSPLHGQLRNDSGEEKVTSDERIVTRQKGGT
jgi:hypothetical protein